MRLPWDAAGRAGAYPRPGQPTIILTRPRRPGAGQPSRLVISEVRQPMTVDAKPKTSITHAIRHELVQYAIITAYLYVCFGVVLLYKASVLRASGVGYTPYGVAAIKALILAKFMLLGHSARVGERYRHKPLIYPILHQSFLFMVLLLVLSVIEEAIAGVIHGRSAVDSVEAMGGGSAAQLVMTCVLMWLILVPYIAIRQINTAMGEGNLRRMFFGAPRDARTVSH